jgi:hypothetical protein
MREELFDSKGQISIELKISLKSGLLIFSKLTDINRSFVSPFFAISLQEQISKKSTLDNMAFI